MSIWLHRAFEQRLEADYADLVNVTLAEAQECYNQASEFLNQAREYLDVLLK